MNVFVQHTNRNSQGASGMCQVVSKSCLFNVCITKDISQKCKIMQCDLLGLSSLLKKMASWQDMVLDFSNIVL